MVLVTFYIFQASFLLAVALPQGPSNSGEAANIGIEQDRGKYQLPPPPPANWTYPPATSVSVPTPTPNSHHTTPTPSSKHMPKKVHHAVDELIDYYGSNHTAPASGTEHIEIIYNAPSKSEEVYATLNPRAPKLTKSPIVTAYNESSYAPSGSAPYSHHTSSASVTQKYQTSSSSETTAHTTTSTVSEKTSRPRPHPGSIGFTGP